MLTDGTEGVKHAWWMVEQNDAKSGHHHLAQARRCLVFLLTVELEGEAPKARAL